MLRAVSVMLMFVTLLGCGATSTPVSVSSAPSVDEPADTADVGSTAEEESVAEHAFMQIAEKYGDVVDVPTLPVEQRTIFLVYHIDATLDAGGFDLLFEADGEPHSALILKAYDTIGAAKGKEAIEVAYNAFEGGIPPKDRKERMQKWKSRTLTVDLNELYSMAREEVRTKLEEYAMKHRNRWNKP